MAIEKRLPPKASALTASLRSMGYTLETAVADIIDNSITANATKVEIFCTFEKGIPIFCIIDNGCGMFSDTLLDALVIGGKDPREERDERDLGRFGLGLKTASFSQGRRVVVASRRDGHISAGCWDLDLIEKRQDWVVTILEAQDIKGIDFISELSGDGTIIVWSKLDALIESIDESKQEAFVNSKLDVLEKHLSLVFHRFLAGTVSGYSKLSIYINGHKVLPFDPFCLSNKATQILPEEKVNIGKSIVKIQPYILPHYSKIDEATRQIYKDRSDFVSNQGAYIYRNGRLMAWGDWFRLIPKGEATKLARVKIDFSNELDELWTLDIKKSVARPPAAVRERLKQVIAKVSSGSTRVSKGHGKKLFSEDRAPLWSRYAEQGLIRYSINEHHPMVSRLFDGLSEQQVGYLDIILKAIGASIPAEMIYSDFSTDPKNIATSLDELKEDMEHKLQLLFELVTVDGYVDLDAFKTYVRSTHLFDHHEDLVETFIQKNWNV